MSIRTPLPRPLDKKQQHHEINVRQKPAASKTRGKTQEQEKEPNERNKPFRHLIKRSRGPKKIKPG